MSVLVVVKVSGDTAAFRRAMADRAEEFEAVRARAQGAGAIHHRFGVGDGVVVAIDEWESAEAFTAFFDDPRMHEFIGSIGADPAPPEITITEAVTSPDEF